MASNKTAWLDEAGKPLRVGDSEAPKPGSDDIVVKNHAIAINPVDYIQAASGFMIQSWPKALGSDIAGEVFEVGSNVKRFKKGDRVVGEAQGLIRGTPEDGAFSLYTRLPAKNAAVLPANIAFKDAAVLPMAIGTASSGLITEDHLNQPVPSTNPTSSDKVLVVYGGSTSIGSMATQMASASGIRVIAIASSKNFEFCRKCGAKDVFDYNDTNVVNDVVNAVKNATFVGIFDAISKEQTYKIDLAILEKLGGGNMATCQPPPKDLPSNIKANLMFGVGEHSAPVWENYVTPALESGQLKCLPEPLVVGKGLESLQKAMERAQAGVSAQKVVVEL